MNIDYKKKYIKYKKKYIKYKNLYLKGGYKYLYENVFINSDKKNFSDYNCKKKDNVFICKNKTLLNDNNDNENKIYFDNNEFIEPGPELEPGSELEPEPEYELNKYEIHDYDKNMIYNENPLPKFKECSVNNNIFYIHNDYLDLFYKINKFINIIDNLDSNDYDKIDDYINAVKDEDLKEFIKKNKIFDISSNINYQFIDNNISSDFFKNLSELIEFKSIIDNYKNTFITMYENIEDDFQKLEFYKLETLIIILKFIKSKLENTRFILDLNQQYKLKIYKCLVK